MKHIILMFIIILAFTSGCTNVKNDRIEGSNVVDKQREVIEKALDKEEQLNDAPEDFVDEQPIETKDTQEQSDTLIDQNEIIDETKKEEETLKELYITVNGQTRKVNLYDNQTTNELLMMLPMTITMDDLHRNEKYIYLDQNLSTQSQSIANIQKGDLMLYGSNCLVLFYESFPTTFQYTPIGKIENPISLDQIVGSGSIQVTFELK